MKFNYPQAPLKLLDGIPSFKAGEWLGHKSNKFERIRKCIRPVDKEDVLLGCDFFNQNPRKRHFSLEPTKESEFRPCMKIFKEAYYTSKDLSREVIIWPQKKRENNINLEQKRHYYQYRDEYIEKLNMKAKKANNKVYVKDELNYLSKIGYLHDKKDLADHLQKSKTEEDYEKMKKDKYSPANITLTIQTELVNINEADSNKKNALSLINPYQQQQSVKDMLEKNKHIDPLFLIPQLSTKPQMKKQKTATNRHDYLTQKREQAIQQMKIRMELIKKDIEYVRELDEWDNNNIIK
jgi:hypothetical protein